MTKPGLPVPIEEQEDTFLRNIHRLFFRPKVYFEGITAPKKKGWLFVFALSFGVAGAISRASTGGGTPAPTWTAHWGWILGGGFIGMLLAYFLGGVWYMSRLGFCGAHDEDKKLVRLVYLSSAQIVAIPLIVMELIATFRYPDPAAAEAGVPVWLASLVLLFNFWSYYASYVGVTTVFKVPKLRAAIWFLVLPILFIILIVGLGAWAALSENKGSGSLESAAPRAEISVPQTFSDFGMTFSYPSNWSITYSGQDEIFMGSIEIQGGGGVYLQLQRQKIDDGAEALADEMIKGVTEVGTPLGEPEPFETWGKLKGFGRRLEVLSEEISYEVRHFVAPVAEGQVFIAYETFPTDIKSQVEPGFKLIRRTFRMTR